MRTVFWLAGGLGLLVSGLVEPIGSGPAQAAPALPAVLDAPATLAQYDGPRRRSRGYPGKGLREAGWYPGKGLRDYGWYPGKGLRDARRAERRYYRYGY